MGIGRIILVTALATVGTVALVGAVGSAQPKANCTDAVAKVRVYQAPGQRLPLEAQVRMALEASGRPVQVQGWRTPNAHRDYCGVGYGVIIGNQAEQLLWWYYPATGKVEAANDLARRYSGW